MSPEPVYILGAGMHPWGKWGHDFTEYGVTAARSALAEAGIDWRQIQFVAGADTIRSTILNPLCRRSPASAPTGRVPPGSAVSTRIEAG